MVCFYMVNVRSNLSDEANNVIEKYMFDNKIRNKGVAIDIFLKKHSGSLSCEVSNYGI